MEQELVQGLLNLSFCVYKMGVHSLVSVFANLFNVWLNRTVGFSHLLPH